MSSKRSRVHPKYKTKYRVRNWPAYDRSLVARGDVTLWITRATPGNPDHVQPGGAVLHDTITAPMPPGWAPDPMLMGMLPPPPGYEWIKKE